MPRELNIIEKLVKELSFAEKQAIISDYELFEEQGFIGDCRLRQAAQELVDKNNLPSSIITTWMRDVAFECYRTFARYYIDSITSKKEG